MLSIEKSLVRETQISIKKFVESLFLSKTGKWIFTLKNNFVWILNPTSDIWKLKKCAFAIVCSLDQPIYMSTPAPSYLNMARAATEI